MEYDRTGFTGSTMSKNETRLASFDPENGLDRGRGRFTEMLWYLCKMFFFLSPFPWPNKMKRTLLVFFGAKVGTGLIIKPRVNIHFPWKLIIGDDVWIGEEVFILNFEPLSIGSNACISQRAFLCGGNHDYRDPAFKYRNEPIIIGSGVWIGAFTFTGPGVHIRENCVITAGSVVTSDLPEDMVCSGNPCRPIKGRWKKES
ncbi:WcaF family extracellular polysaccharide biosynthesis acetyltransferase [Marinoscillum sp.]|uniref:WcaF family extracellular polysaccharide biosynthesis acetyltransferase n=1 Tax=Marinoscillum sp. TaxID=2024838 RepID=UPI003BAAF4E3